MVYNTQNRWVSGVCPSHGILNTKKQRFGSWMCFRLPVKMETPAQLGPLERANRVQRLRLAPSKGGKLSRCLPLT
jgi:hypothetical protein